MAKFKRKHEDVMHIYNESFKKEKVEYEKSWMDIFTKSVGVTGKAIFCIVIAIYALVLVMVFANFADIKEKVNPDVNKYLKDHYNCNFKFLEENIDEKR